MIKNYFLKVFLTVFLFLFTLNTFCQVEKAEADIKDIIKELKVVGLSVVVVKKKIFFMRIHLA
jgi:hypothetical protein